MIQTSDVLALMGQNAIPVRVCHDEDRAFALGLVADSPALDSRSPGRLIYGEDLRLGGSAFPGALPVRSAGAAGKQEQRKQKSFHSPQP